VISAVDTNILLDILLPNPTYVEQSKSLLNRARRRGGLIINEVVSAELAVHLPERRELDQFLREGSIVLRPSTPEALSEAAQAWRQYLRHRSDEISCPQCGFKQSIQCPRCGRRIQRRQHIISDFLIGGHALVLAQTLLTRDRGYYRTYFPKLPLNKIPD